LCARGATDEEAFRSVVRELDATDLLPELQVSEKNSSAAIPQRQELLARDNGIFDFLQDLHYAARTLRKEAWLYSRCGTDSGVGHRPPIQRFSPSSIPLF